MNLYLHLISEALDYSTVSLTVTEFLYAQLNSRDPSDQRQGLQPRCGQARNVCAMASTKGRACPQDKRREGSRGTSLQGSVDLCSTATVTWRIQRSLPASSRGTLQCQVACCAASPKQHREEITHAFIKLSTDPDSSWVELAASSSIRLLGKWSRYTNGIDRQNPLACPDVLQRTPYAGL